MTEHARLDTTDLRRNIVRMGDLSRVSVEKKLLLVERSLLRIQKEARQYARSGGAFSRRSVGILARNINYKINSDGTGTITTGVKYGMIQEFGGQTKPHLIRPINGKALAFASGPGGYSNAARIGNGKKFHSVLSGRVSAAFAKGKSVTGMTVVNHVHHPGSKIPGTHYTRISFERQRLAIIKDARRMVASQAGGKAWP